MKRLASLAAFAVALATTFAAPSARADGGIYQCAPNAPGGVVMTCIPAGPDLMAAQPPAAPYGYAPPLVERTLDGRTHNWLAPTGELLRKGDAEVSLHEFFFATGAVGVTDNLELNFSMPLIPVFASVGARVGLTGPGNPLKLVIGAAAYAPLFDDGGDSPVVGQVTGTIAYATPRFNLHASMSAMKATSDDDVIGMLNVGATIKLGHKVALMGELVEFSDKTSYDTDTLGLSMIGLKFMGASTDIDLGIAFPTHVNGEAPDSSVGPVGMPILSTTYKF
jgi:hypothetical protein